MDGTSLQYAIDKLEKYLKILDENPAYWAAFILHPGRRMKLVRLFYDGWSSPDKKRREHGSEPPNAR